MPNLRDGPPPDSHAHVNPGNEGGFVHLAGGPVQQACVSPPHGWGCQGGARGGVLGMS